MFGNYFSIYEYFLSNDKRDPFEVTLTIWLSFLLPFYLRFISLFPTILLSFFCLSFCKFSSFPLFCLFFLPVCISPFLCFSFCVFLSFCVLFWLIFLSIFVSAFLLSYVLSLCRSFFLSFTFLFAFPYFSPYPHFLSFLSFFLPIYLSAFRSIFLPQPFSFQRTHPELNLHRPRNKSVTVLGCLPSNNLTGL